MTGNASYKNAIGYRGLPQKQKKKKKKGGRSLPKVVFHSKDDEKNPNQYPQKVIIIQFVKLENHSTICNRKKNL